MRFHSSIGSANPWPGARLPRGPAAVLAALHMRAPRLDAFDVMSDADWRRAAEFADSSGVTLVWQRNMGSNLPSWLRDRAVADLARNRQRVVLIEELYRALHQRLSAAGIEYLALKGLTQCPQFGTPAELRRQLDVDLFVPWETVHRAGEMVHALGFEPFDEKDRVPTDHLPPYVQRTNWEFNGDYFDAEMPLAVELHFQFWNRKVERIAVPDVERFWGRRTTRRLADIEMPVLHTADGLGYAALHLLRHVLRGSARAFHIYEIAGFLESHAADDAFWQEWRTLHTPEFRLLQAVIFRLAAEWFGCELGSVVREEVANLPAATRAWFDDFALSPATAIFYPQKNELWLHWSLLDSWRDKLGAARLRLLPVNAPGPVDGTPDSEMTLRRRIRRGWRYTSHIGSRAARHAAALPHALLTGLRWWRTTRAR